MTIVARIRTDFPTKFGIPRQSGMVEGLRGRIVFEPEYRNAEALRGLERCESVICTVSFGDQNRENRRLMERGKELGILRTADGMEEA